MCAWDGALTAFFRWGKCRRTTYELAAVSVGWIGGEAISFTFDREHGI
jgi:hypothetical protein